jgi:hypothetical protein
MADDQKDRLTSHAQNVDGLVHKESPLDRALALKEQFQRAQNQHLQSRQAEQAKGGAQQGSQMVKSHAPGQHLRMRGPLGAAVDKNEHKTEFRKEDAAEKQKQESARKAMEAFISRQKSGPDHDRDNEK